jgi:hypothetical protein
MFHESQNQNNSIILNLESLTKEYDTLLMQYNQVQSDYINYLGKTPSAIHAGKGETNANLSIIPNSTFWGSSGISNTNVSSVDKCSALCSKTPGCNGATYNVTNSSQNNCWLRSGDGMVITGTNEQYAIIHKSKEYLLTLQTLNSQLIDANNKIMEVFKKYQSIQEQDTEKKNKFYLLKQNYEKLEKERLNILKQLENYQTIESKQMQGELIVTKNYYNYILLFILVLFCLFILSRISIAFLKPYVVTNNNNFRPYIF